MGGRLTHEPSLDSVSVKKSPVRRSSSSGDSCRVACGLFFGEYCRPLQLVGQAYVKLLQMTVMPTSRSR